MGNQLSHVTPRHETLTQRCCDAGQRRRRCPNITPTLGEREVNAGNTMHTGLVIVFIRFTNVIVFNLIIQTCHSDSSDDVQVSLALHDVSPWLFE